MFRIQLGGIVITLELDDVVIILELTGIIEEVGGIVVVVEVVGSLGTMTKLGVHEALSELLFIWIETLSLIISCVNEKVS